MEQVTAPGTMNPASLTPVHGGEALDSASVPVEVQAGACVVAAEAEVSEAEAAVSGSGAETTNSGF